MVFFRDEALEYVVSVLLQSPFDTDAVRLVIHELQAVDCLSLKEFTVSDLAAVTVYDGVKAVQLTIPQRNSVIKFGEYYSQLELPMDLVIENRAVRTLTLSAFHVFRRTGRMPTLSEATSSSYPWSAAQSSPNKHVTISDTVASPIAQSRYKVEMPQLECSQHSAMDEHEASVASDEAPRPPVQPVRSNRVKKRVIERKATGDSSELSAMLQKKLPSVQPNSSSPRRGKRPTTIGAAAMAPVPIEETAAVATDTNEVENNGSGGRPMPASATPSFRRRRVLNRQATGDSVTFGSLMKPPPQTEAEKRRGRRPGCPSSAVPEESNSSSSKDDDDSNNSDSLTSCESEDAPKVEVTTDDVVEQQQEVAAAAPARRRVLHRQPTGDSMTFGSMQKPSQPPPPPARPTKRRGRRPERGGDEEESSEKQNDTCDTASSSQDDEEEEECEKDIVFAAKVSTEVESEETVAATPMEVAVVVASSAE